MACKIDAVKMVPASESDTIDPGSFYFACLNLQRKTDPDSYWIVLRAPREWLPDGFFDTRPVQLRVFPFWIVGKDQRVWLPRSSLFNLDRSQREIFADRAKRHEFANTVILVDSFQTVNAALAHFEHKILESTKQYNERRERVDRTLAQSRRLSRSISPFPDGSVTAELPGSKRKVESGSVEDEAKPSDQDLMHQGRDFSNPPKRRRLNITKSVRSPPSSILNKGSDVSKTRIHDKAQKPVPTPEKMSDEPVRIFAGAAQQQFMANTAVVKRGSDLMFSWIVSDDQGKYIRHPLLDELDPPIFKAILDYMKTGDYAPRIMGRTRMPWDIPCFDGCSTPEDYDKVLLQSAKVYNISKVLKVTDLDKHVHTRLMIGENLCTDLGWIEFARVLWSRPFTIRFPLGPATHTQQPARAWTPAIQGHYPHACNQIGYETTDKHTVQMIAGRFDTIMEDPDVLKAYLSMVESAKNRLVHAAILEETADHYRTMNFTG